MGKTRKLPCNFRGAAFGLAVLFAVAFTALSGFAADADVSGKVWQIGVAKIVSHAALDAAEKGFEAGLASAGFKEGVNIVYDRHNAQGELERATAIAEKLAAGNYDLIHSIATPTTQAVIKVATNIPVVFSAVTDPAAAGIVPHNSAPGNKTGTNITGVSDKWPVHLQMRTYAKFVPKAKIWGTIYNPAEDNSVSHVSEMRQAAIALGLQLIEVHATNADEVVAAARSLVGRVQAIAITADNTSVANFELIATICNEAKIALFAGDVDSVPKGAVAAYGTDYYLIGYSAGKKAALILKGIAPGDIPWGLMEKFSLVINRRAAKLQDVTLEPDLLRKADKILD
ncbi:MAG: ABC transporter substrate-binding protein [Proteobacteria bacterium]|nr:ABC transporter substrate-binding protein [Pseudomonadota bacterium]